MNIFVSMRVIDCDSYVEVRDAISHDWCEYFSNYEFLPIFMPNNINKITNYFEKLSPAGLLLTGGNDLCVEDDHPLFNAIKQRNEAETKMLELAIKMKLPVLGVCRGLQIINQYFKGKVTHVDSKKHVAVNHNIKIIKNIFSDKKRTEVEVNSYHNYGVYKKDLSKELNAFSVSSDDCVEGFYHKDLPIYAIQWHPERINNASDFDHEIFQYWLEKCS
jgi:N5-(cytidine 5'-diphosphoramidyl)-L-glutamine hydrolase